MSISAGIMYVIRMILPEKRGVTKRMEVSNIEIWAECFGKPKEDMKNADSYSISAIMARLDGWVKTGKTKTIPIYGKQRIYARKE